VAPKKTTKSKSTKKESAGPFDALKALKQELEKKEAAAPAKRAPAPPPPPPPRAPETPQDEAQMLHRLLAGVTPLDRSKGSRVPRQKVERSEAVEQRARHGAELAAQEREAVHEHLRALVEGRGRFEVADDGLHVEGRRVDVPADTVRKLRRGTFPIDARLDLHGMAVADARARLEVFLRTTRARGERCVLVIHGKGEHSPQGLGVLRGEMAAWLSQGSPSEHVAAFSTAREADGGEGAVYVMLRR
jgi:DNA-nicking Smr family endonuclease